MSAETENLKVRYILLLRLVAFAFIVSTGFFLAFILLMKVPQEALPFSSASGERLPFYGFLPLLGVLFIIAGLFLMRDSKTKVTKSRAVLPRDAESRLRKLLLTATVAFMLIQMGIIPGILWFLVTSSMDWAVILSASSLVTLICAYPRRDIVERVIEGAEIRISE